MAKKKKPLVDFTVAETDVGLSEFYPTFIPVIGTNLPQDPDAYEVVVLDQDENPVTDWGITTTPYSSTLAVVYFSPPFFFSPSFVRKKKRPPLILGEMSITITDSSGSLTLSTINAIDVDALAPPVNPSPP